MPGFFVGLMSGTSLDGVDGVVLDFNAIQEPPLQVLAHVHAPFKEGLREDLLSLNSPGANELHRCALAGAGVARAYAEVVNDLRARAGLAHQQVTAIGAHGQTVRHRPGEFDGIGYSAQLLAPALLAELTRIDVICDFRSRDIAAGGQGAPLVPAFHCMSFASLAPEVAVLNLGGISNLTVIRERQAVHGFDCGPGNALLDYWCARHTGAAFDGNGAWSATGQADAGLLAAMLEAPYFSQLPPKSTGRDLFNSRWLDDRLQESGTPLRPADVQATLVELTATCCARSVRRFAGGSRLLVVCGGGAFNTHLMARLAANLPGVSVQPSSDFGLPADQVEACAFAWLARAFVQRDPGNLPAVTGALGFRVLGALYPAF